MVRLRTLVRAIAAASVLTSGMAHGLGLGEITLKSALNQPLDAEIELLEVRDLGSGEVIPSLASPEEFSKAGVDRLYYLTDLKFTPVVKPNGKSVIRVTSSKPVQEPYLNFLVQVLWPNGRLLREYTVLLDPPLYSPQAAASAPQAPVSAPRATGAPRAPQAPAPVRTTAPAGSDTYRTVSNDTLWEIAQRNRTDRVSVPQAMLAFQELNPGAFVDGNINRLKSGQVLRIPTEQQMLERSPREALSQVQAQNQSWRGSRNPAAGSAGARQLDATQRNAAGSAPSKVDATDNLRLVSGEGKASKGADKGGKGDSKAIADTLAVTKESLDSTRRENEELQSRMQDLQSQLDKLQKLIQLKDAQLAKLQGQLGAEGQGAAQPNAALPDASQPNAAAQAPAQPGTPAAAAPTPAPAGEAPAAPAQPPVAPPPAPAAEKPPAPAVPAPAPVQAAEQPAPSFLDELLANPLWLAVIGGSALLALLVLLMILSRRNAQKEKEEVQAFAADAGEEQEDALDLGKDGFDDLTLDEPEPQVAAAAPQVEKTTAQTSDALGEADIYIAYGRFNQAAELLQNAIYDEPQRTDLRLKLMEVYAEMGDREGFARQENELREIGGAQPQVEQLKSRYPAMVVVAAVAGLAGAKLVSAGQAVAELARARQVEIRHAILGGEFEYLSFNRNPATGETREGFLGKVERQLERIAGALPCPAATCSFFEMCGGEDGWHRAHGEIVQRLEQGDYGQTGLDYPALESIFLSRLPLYEKWFASQSREQIWASFVSQAAEYALMGKLFGERFDNFVVLAVDHYRMEPFYSFFATVPTLYIRTDYL